MDKEGNCSNQLLLFLCCFQVTAADAPKCNFKIPLGLSFLNRFLYNCIQILGITVPC